MKRFAIEKPQVLPESMARTSKQRGVEHRYRGGTGVILRVGPITWIDEKTADVSGGYYEGNLSASGNTYYVEKKDGKWTVTEDKMHWIS